jgi:hypothetical protein
MTYEERYGERYEYIECEILVSGEYESFYYPWSKI